MSYIVKLSINDTVSNGEHGTNYAEFTIEQINNKLNKLLSDYRAKPFKLRNNGQKGNKQVVQGRINELQMVTRRLCLLSKHTSTCRASLEFIDKLKKNLGGAGKILLTWEEVNVAKEVTVKDVVERVQRNQQNTGRQVGTNQRVPQYA